MAANGRKITIIVIAYMLVKSVLNLILSPGGANVVTLIMYLVFAFLMIAPSSTFPPVAGFFRYSNYITSVYLGLTVLAHISYNLTNLPGSLIYLIEGMLDIAAMVLLCVPKDTREFFLSK